MTQMLIDAKAEITDHIPSFRRWLRAKNRAPRTVATYEAAIQRFAAFVAANGMPQDITAVRREHVETFIEWLGDHQKQATAANRYRSLQSFFKFLVEDGEITRSPMERMSPPQVTDVETPVLHEPELRRLLSACSGRTFEARRDLAIIRLMIDTGARIGEVLRLAVDDLNLDAGQLTLNGKGRRKRTVSIGAKTARALDGYLKLRRQHLDAGTDALWLGRRGPLTDQGLRLAVRRRGEQAGLGRIWPHQLRHSAASSWLAAGGSEGDLMRLMGWASREMLSRYASSTATDRAVAAHKRLALADRL